jgi:hypothetical protein
MDMELHKLEYTFYFHTRNLGDTVRKGTNPFTGEPVEFPIDEGLSQSERDALTKVLAAHGFNGPEPDGEGYALYLPNDQSVRIRSGEFDRTERIPGFAVEIIVLELTDDILKIMLDVAQSGNLALTSVTGEDVRLVSRPDDDKALKRWPDARPLESTAELRTWLVDVIEGRQVL